MDKELRIDLLRDHGKAWGDDEIRFHVAYLLNHPRSVSKAQFATIPGFVTMDPLLARLFVRLGVEGIKRCQSTISMW